jgi:hypothetical protein
VPRRMMEDQTIRAAYPAAAALRSRTVAAGDRAH